MSSCLNHPSVEASGRCKQCNKPYCTACRVQGPTGNFCSDECKVNHETFMRRAKALDDMKGAGGGMRTIKKFIGSVVTLSIAGVILAIAATIMGFDIPVVSEFFRDIVDN